MNTSGPSSDLSDWSDHLEQVLRNTAVPRRVLVYRQTASTQDIARAHAAQRVVVFADEQSAGRGRLGRRWQAPAGTAILMSLTHPIDEARGESSDRITFVTAVALAESLERWVARRLEIKWPNDIVAEGAKLAGILVETVQLAGGQRVAIIGIGINVAQSAEDLARYPQELRRRITSLSMLGARADRRDVAADAVERIDALLASGDTARLLDAWRTRNLMSEQRVTLVSEGRTITGTVVDLDPTDGLIVRRDSGEIVHLPAATTTVR